MAQGVQNGKPRMSRSRGGLYLATVVLLLLLPCLGLWGSRAYLRAKEAGDLARWRRLEPLPARGVEIVAGDWSTVYVRTAGGSIYACRHRDGGQGPKDCWYKAQMPPDADRDTPFYQLPETRQKEVRAPAGTMVDTFEVTYSSAEAWSETRYVLMQDGSVLKWERSGGIGGFLTLGLGLIIGLAVGGVAVVVLWVRAVDRR